MTRAILRAAFLQLALVGCDRGVGPGAESGPRLEVRWTGADTGRMAGPATAEWCERLRVLEIRGVRGDSGVALALYPGDSVRADSYPVVRPERADSAPPAAAVALRWFAETTVKGYRGDSGGVVVAAAAEGRLSGRFTAWLGSVHDENHIRASGSFHDLRVVPASRGCVARAEASPPDTGVH